MDKAKELGVLPLGILLKQQAIPASIGILIMSIYMIVDTIFVGHYIGSLGIGAITVVMPIVWLISSIGMALGIGGASITSISLGAKQFKKANLTFGNQITLVAFFSILFMYFGFKYIDEILLFFGGKGAILPMARIYFKILLYSMPALSFAMMSNNIVRSLGFPKIGMLGMTIPAIANLILDPVFIVYFDMGIAGAAYASALSYTSSAVFLLCFFIFAKTGISIKAKYFIPNFLIIKEIASIGSVTLARQGTLSVMAIVLNNTLYSYGGEVALSVYGIINRMMMFVNFPLMGITQGFLPIVGYNYGAENWDRVSDIIRLSVKTSVIIATGIFILLIVFAPQIVSIFTKDVELIEKTIPAFRITFLAMPIIAFNFIGSAYFQAIGKSIPAILLTMTKQGFFLIPLIIILPKLIGMVGVWTSFPIADIGASIVTYLYFNRYIKKNKHLSKGI